MKVLLSLDSLNKHPPCKKKHATGNQMPFFNKELSKAVMTKTKLRNIFLRQERGKQNTLYKTKKCFYLLRKTKERYKNQNEKSAVDNKLLWKTVKPLQSDKVTGKSKINSIENNELVKTDLETAEISSIVQNRLFTSIVQNLDISNDEPLVILMMQL